MNNDKREPKKDEADKSLDQTAVQDEVKVTDNPETTTGGTGKLPEGGPPNPGFVARGD